MGSVSEQVENPFRYASYRYDTESGLYYLQNRYYNPDLMRFITRDAIRDIVGKPSTSNFYHYADGNPIMKIDPNGLWVVYTKWITEKKAKDFAYYLSQGAVVIGVIAAMLSVAWWVAAIVFAIIVGALTYYSNMFYRYAPGGVTIRVNYLPIVGFYLSLDGKVI